MEEKKELFKKYVDNYDRSIKQIDLKYYHTLRVMDFCFKISKSLGMNDSDIKLSQTIGLTHDIARFYQYTEYKTFNDSESIDHGDYALNIIDTDEIVKRIVEDVDVSILKEAVKYHNKLDYDHSLDDKTKTFCKIIRDADKLDILDLFIQNKIDNEVKESSISPEVYDVIFNHQSLSFKITKTKLDFELAKCCFIFDLNFKYSLNYIKDNNIIDRMMDKIINNNLNEKDKLERIRMELLKYLKERMSLC